MKTRRLLHSAGIRGSSVSTKSQSRHSHSSHFLHQLRVADGDVSKEDTHFPLASCKHATCAQQQQLFNAFTRIWPKNGARCGKESQLLCFSFCLLYLNSYNIPVYPISKHCNNTCHWIIIIIFLNVSLIYDSH